MSQQKKLVLLSIFPNAPKSLVFDRVELLDAPRDPPTVQLIARALKTTKNMLVARGSQMKQAVVRRLARVFRSNNVSNDPDSVALLENQDADDHEDIVDWEETFFVPLDMYKYPDELLLLPTFGGINFEALRKTDEMKDLTTLLRSRSPEKRINVGGCYVEYTDPAATDDQEPPSDQSCKDSEDEKVSESDERGSTTSRHGRMLSSSVSNMLTKSSGSEEVALSPQRLNLDDYRTNGGMSVVCCAGYVYVIGVIMDKASTDGVIRAKVREKSDESTIVWQKVVDLPLKCPFHASTASKDEIFITGGRSKNNVDHQVLRTFLTHRPKSGGNWSVFNGIPLPREHHALVYLNGNLYLIGGKDEFETFKDVYVCQVHLTPNQWMETTSMHKPRFSFVTAVHESHIYVAGGYPRRELTVVSVERFDTKVDMWEQLQPYCASDNPMIGFTFGDWICILGGRPMCLNVSKMNGFNQETLDEAGGRPSTPQIKERVWEEQMRFELPILNLNRRSAVVATMMCKT